MERSAAPHPAGRRDRRAVTPRRPAPSPSATCCAAADRCCELRDLRVRTYRVDRPRRHDLPRRDHRDPVPAAAVLPARLRLDRRARRPGGDCVVRRQHRIKPVTIPLNAPLRHPPGYHGSAASVGALGRLPRGIALLQPARRRGDRAVLCLSGIFRSIGFTAYNTYRVRRRPGRPDDQCQHLHRGVQELGAGLGRGRRRAAGPARRHGALRSVRPRRSIGEEAGALPGRVRR